MFSFFRRKKKQETPAQEETRIQETAAEAVENAEAAVSQTLETVQETRGSGQRNRCRKCFRSGRTRP